MRDLNRQLGSPSHWLPMKPAKKRTKRRPSGQLGSPSFLTSSVKTCNSLNHPYSCYQFGCSYDCFCVFAIYDSACVISFSSLPSRASTILFVFRLFLSLRWMALYARERSHANPHAHGEAHLVKPYRPRDVSDTETILSLILNARRPRLRRGLLQQHRIVPGCLKRRVLLGGVCSLHGLSFP